MQLSTWGSRIRDLKRLNSLIKKAFCVLGITAAPEDDDAKKNSSKNQEDYGQL